jgi:hypothetical protein
VSENYQIQQGEGGVVGLMRGYGMWEKHYPEREEDG